MSELFYGVWAIIGIGIILRFTMLNAMRLWDWFDYEVLVPLAIWRKKRGHR